MSDKLLVEGNTVAAQDELYLWLSNSVAIPCVDFVMKCMAEAIRKSENENI